MPPQKRKASTIASAKIAEDAGGSRKRKSDAKEQRTSAKETNDDGKHDIERNVSDDKKEHVDEHPDNKRRKKKQSNAQENDVHDNGTNGKDEPQGHDLTNPTEHDQMLIDEYNKSAELTQSTNKEVNDKQSKTEQIETRKELEKKMPADTLEKGHICFLHPPKVAGTDEIQTMYMVLIPYMSRPSSSDEPNKSYFTQAIQAIDNKLQEDDEKPIPGKMRIIMLGKKTLPNIEKHAKLWAFVDKAFTEVDEVKGFVTGRKYKTATRGERALAACRLMGRGVYNIVQHKGHAHLAYVLEFPEEPNDVQNDFNIKHEGSYVTSVKNPEVASPQYASLGDNEKVNYPTRLSEKFGGRRFISLPSTEFMDYDGAELLFIGARESIAEESGEAGSELEELADLDIKEIAPLTAERVIYEELHLEKEILPCEPLHDLWKQADL